MGLGLGENVVVGLATRRQRRRQSAMLEAVKLPFSMPKEPKNEAQKADSASYPL